MSSESKGSKPDLHEGAPTSGTSSRLSARAPSAWGATRDALAALHNLDALLRSDSVLYRTILDLLPELRASAGVLREAFERARDPKAAAAEVGQYGVGRVSGMLDLLEATALADDEREDLARRARDLAGELEATADLLALLERAADPATTDVNVELVVRETARLSASGRGRELTLRLDAAGADCTVHADPYVVGPLFALMVSWVSASGAEQVAARVRSDDAAVTFTAEPARSADASRAALSMRVLPAVPPTESAARRVAAEIRATLQLSEARGLLRIARTAG